MRVARSTCSQSSMNSHKCASPSQKERKKEAAWQRSSIQQTNEVDTPTCILHLSILFDDGYDSGDDGFLEFKPSLRYNKKRMKNTWLAFLVESLLTGTSSPPLATCWLGMT